MKVTTEKNDGYVLMTVEGRIDTTNYSEFEAEMNKVLGEGAEKVLLDCSGLNYISSSGLRVFLLTQKKMMASGGKFKLFGMQPAIKEIFDISGFSSIFSISENKELALQD